MATTGDGRASYESRGDGEKSRKAFRPDIDEEPHNVSQDAGQNSLTGVSDHGGNSTSVSAATWISELEQMWKQKTFTRSVIQYPTTMENLPADLLLNIFIRLFAKQLAQMRCVSKFWNAHLSQPSFIKSHLSRSIHNNNQILLVFYKYLSSSSDPKPFTAHPYRSPHLDLTNFIKLPPPPVNPNFGHTSSMIKVIASVHGLICSRYGDDVIHIWNPSLSAVSTLPPYSGPSCSGNDISFRFGFDPKTEDYKVVKLSNFSGPPTRRPATLAHVVKEWLEVEVYSMRKGSWELVTQRFPSHVTKIFEPDCVCVDGHDGHLHWLGYIDEEGDRQTIVAFDLGSETFREIPFPDAIQHYNYSNALGVLAGKIIVVSWYEDDKDEIDVWVMDEYGVAESWIKRHVFSWCIRDVVYGPTSHSEFVFVGDDLRLLLYNPAVHKVRVLMNFLRGKYSVDKIVEYVDSLVWIAPAI